MNKKDFRFGLDIKIVKINDIESNDWNPNEMNDLKFQELVKEVIAEGIDQPVVVIAHPEKKDKYLAVDGYHRWAAAREAGLKEIPVVLKSNWDLIKAKIETVRRNALRGELNPYKFTDLVNSLSANMDTDRLLKEMAMDEQEFNKYYKMDEEAKIKLLEDVNVPKEKALLDDASYIVQRIIEQNKDNLDKGYIFFMFKGAVVLCLEMEKEQKHKLIDLVTNAQEKGKNLHKMIFGKIFKE